MTDTTPFPASDGEALKALAWLYHDGPTPDRVPDDMMGSVLISQKRYGGRNETPLCSLTEAQARIAELENERGERQAWAADESTRNRHLTRELAAIRAEYETLKESVEAAEKDAARWRWLRDHSVIVEGQKLYFGPGFTQSSADEADAAIDAFVTVDRAGNGTEG